MEEHVYPGDKPPSRFRGWFRNFIGIITFNRRKRVEGKIERQDAKAYHQAMRIRERQRRDREYSRSRHRSTSKGYHRSSSRRSRRKSSRHQSSSVPFLHFRRRTHPSYHGAHYRFWGFLTRNRDHQSRGLAMKEDADRGRRRERRRRLRWLQQEGQAIRMGAATLFRGPKHPPQNHQSSRRTRHHSSHGHRSAAPPVIVTHGAAEVYANSQPVPIQVARSIVNGHAHHQHHSTSALQNARSIPVATSRSRSRHRSMPSGRPTEVVVTPSVHPSHHMSMPMAPTVHSHRESPIAIPVQRSSAGHSARQFYENIGPSHPGTARTSSSRHRSMSGSYHGRHRSHTSHTPSVIQVTA